MRGKTLVIVGLVLWAWSGAPIAKQGLTGNQNSEIARSMKELFEGALERDENDAEAQWSLGWLYQSDGLGLNSPQNYIEAMRWYQKAAAQGHLEAISHIGVMHLEGLGVPKNTMEALKWLTRAGDRGHAVSQGIIATIYVTGPNDHPKDYAAGLRWARLGVEQGDSAGQYALGFLFLNGYGGVLESFSEARRLFLLSAAQHYPLAMRLLGVIQIQGMGVPVNKVKGYTWLILARAVFSSQGTPDSDTEDYSGMVRNTMTVQQVSESQKQATEWLKLNPNPVLNFLERRIQ